MLNKLRTLHADVIAALDALDRLMSLPRPDMQLVATARLRLMSAGRARLNFLENEVYPTLLEDGGNTEVAWIRDSSRSRASTSATYIARWTQAEMECRWQEYTSCAAQMRREVRRSIETESSVLYPLLQKHEAAEQSQASGQIGYLGSIGELALAPTSGRNPGPR